VTARLAQQASRPIPHQPRNVDNLAPQAFGPVEHMLALHPPNSKSTFWQSRRRRGVVAFDRITDQDLLREVMNTVGKPGRLGEQVRCVVSVSMLTEGWDTNTVTHILGVRAFGTQLLCEQVVGRGLRRQSYDLNEDGLFNVEYADILGIPFDFTARPVVAKPVVPKPIHQVKALRERAHLEIVFPRIEGYRVDLPQERLRAVFTKDSRLELNPENVGPCKVLMEGIVGEGVELNAEVLDDIRPSTITFHLARRLLETRFRDPDEDLPVHLFGDVKRVVRRWLDEGYLVATGVPRGAITYLELADQAVERIYLACQRYEAGEKRIKAIPDPYNPRGSTSFVSFNTSKGIYTTAPDKCHVNAVVLDSEWEGELARVLERHPQVISYVKNQGLQFEVPYRDGAVQRRYVPDFIVQVNDGRGSEDPLNLVLEVKGFRRGDAQLKAETMRTLWVPGVNNLGTFGRWQFGEFTDVFEIEEAFEHLLNELAESLEAA
jgi:type III restriction enzyme